MAKAGESAHMALSPPRAASPTPSNTSRRQGHARPSPEEAFDAIVQAANPAHPDHAAWLERFGGSVSALPPGVGGGGGSGSRRGSAVKTRSEAGSVRAGMGMSGFAGAEYLFGAESPPPTAKRGVGAPSLDGGSVRSGAETPKRRRKKRKDGTLSSRDKGKGKALPPPIPPPRTTSAMQYQPLPPPPPQAAVQQQQQPSAAPPAASTSASHPPGSAASSTKSKRGKRKALPLPPVPSSPVRQRTSSITGGRPSDLPAEAVPPVPSSPLVTFARAPVGTAAHRMEMLAAETNSPPLSPSDSPLPHSPVSLSPPLGRPESRASSVRERGGGVAAIRRSLDSVMAPFKGSSNARRAKEAAAAQEVIDRMASSSQGHSQSPAVGSEVVTPIIVSSPAYTSPTVDASSAGEGAARDAEQGQATASQTPPSGGRRPPRVVRPFASSHILAGSSASRPLSSVKDVRESGTEAEFDGFFDARSEDDGAVSAPMSTDDFSPDEASGRAKAKAKPSPSLEQSQRSADAVVTVLRPTGELKQRRSNNSVATARAARTKLNSKDSPLSGVGSPKAEGSTAGESSADEEFFPVSNVGAQRPPSMRRQRSASSQAERVNALQTERALVAQAQAMRRASRDRQGSYNASTSASPQVNAEAVVAETPPLPNGTPVVTAAPVAVPDAEPSPRVDPPLTNEERRQRLAAIEYFIPPVRPGSAGQPGSAGKPGSADAVLSTQRLRTAGSARSLASGYRAPGSAPELITQPQASAVPVAQPLPLQSRQQPNGTPVLDSTPTSPASAGKSTPRGLSSFFDRVKGNRSASKRGDSPSLTNTASNEQAEADAPSVSSHNAKALQGLGIASSGATPKTESGWRSRMPSFGTGSTKGKTSGQWSRNRDPTVSPGISPAPEEGRRDVLAQVVALSLASPKAGAASMDNVSTAYTSHRPIEHIATDPSPSLDVSTARPNGVSHLLGFRKTVPTSGAVATIHKSLSPALLDDTSRHEADDISSTGHVTDEDAAQAETIDEEADAADASYDYNEELDGIDELGGRAAGAAQAPPPKVRLVRSSVDVHSGSDGGHTLFGYTTSNGASSPVSHSHAGGRHGPSSSIADSFITEAATAPSAAATPQMRAPSVASRRIGDEEEIESLSYVAGDATASTSPRSRTPSIATSAAGRSSFAESRRGQRQGAPLTIGTSPRMGILDSFRKATSGKKGSKSQPTTPRLRGISSADHFAEPMPSGATGLAAVENATRLLAAHADQMTPSSFAFSNLNGTDTASTPTDHSYSADTPYGLGLGSLDMEPPPTPPTQPRQRAPSIGTRSLKSVQTHATSPEIDAFAEFLRASTASDAARRAGIAQRAAFAANNSQSQPASPAGH